MQTQILCDEQPVEWLPGIKPDNINNDQPVMLQAGFLPHIRSGLARIARYSQEILRVLSQYFQLSEMEKNLKKVVDKSRKLVYHNTRRRERRKRFKANGSIAQLGEHLPYKQRVTGSSPVVPTIYGAVVQLVRMPACHAGGRGFEPLPRRLCPGSSVGRAGD